MSIGNAVGSVTANLGLIMAIALICMPTVIKRAQILPDAGRGPVPGGFWCWRRACAHSQYSASGDLYHCHGGEYPRSTARHAGRGARGGSGLKQKPAAKEIALNIVKFIAGTVGIVLGAQLLIDNGSELARFIGVPERIIGVTIIAIGTSLPELVTTITAIAKKQASLSVGNIIGANIIDLTLILPISAMIYGGGLPVSRQVAMMDLPACLLVGCHCCDPGFDLQKIPPLAGHCAFVYICRLCCAHLFWFALRPRQVCSAVRRVKKQTLSNEKLSRPFYLEWPAVFFPLVFYTYDFLTRFENVTVVRQNIHILQCGASALHHTVERVICHAGADPRALLHHCIHSVEQCSTAG